METIMIYSASELKEKNIGGFEFAHKKYCDNDASEDSFHADEIVSSMKQVFKNAGILLNDWSIDYSGGSSYVRVGMDEETAELTGKRAENWLKENLLDNASFKRVNYKNNGKRYFRYDITKKNGESWSCEFTGICYDHDFMDSILDDIRGGCELKDAFNNLADKASNLIYAENQSQLEESYFIDHADANDWKFTEDGIRVD